MFDGPDFPKSLSEDVFDEWLENGRKSRLGYQFMLIIFDEFEQDYRPHYVETRAMINGYEMYGNSTSRESLIAAYDLFSESKLYLTN